MRWIPFLVVSVITIALAYMLNRKWGSLPPLGKFFSPQHGFWQNAEPVDEDFNETLHLPGLKEKADVYFDERMVPHVFASNDEDVYYVQGYLHAKFRLWQMEFQTFAAAGRVSQVIGRGAKGEYLKYDRSMRRLGMIYAAEKALKEVEANPVSKAMQDAYTAGVNAYIDQLTASKLPLEYKMLDYKPERWTNLKSALFLKYMSYDLAGGDDDMKFTNARNLFSRNDFEKLYPVIEDSLKPIVPNSAENPYPLSAAMNLSVPADADSLYFSKRDDTITTILPKPDKDNGSNNWAIASSKSATGSPILANDPHLGLNLPSIWYEIQLTTPNFSAYGVSFPGAPGIAIGFNRDIAFGFTNAGRDVKDYYEIRFRDEKMDEYWFDSAWIKTDKRIEQLNIRGQAPVFDTVAYTIFGPVIYDRSFPASEGSKKYYAVKWKAHDPSNEFMLFYGLNHAKNYHDYTEAIKYLSCPGQNPVFAARNGDIAIWQQGDFPAKWRRQGDFVMPGFDSSYMWKGIIPQSENPHMLNPARGYVSSANQLSVDASYPYYTGNVFPVYRGYIINRYLDSMRQASVDDIKKMQVDNYNVGAEFSKDILMQTPVASLEADEKKYFDIYQNWDFRNDPASKGATVYNVWWQELQHAVWDDEINRSGLPMPWPGETTLIESLHRDSSTYKFIDDINTVGKETLPQLLVSALKKAVAKLKEAEGQGKLEWAKFKDTKVQHLLKIPALSRLHLPVGGGSGIINATKTDHGPSWRMVVSMTNEVQGWAVYPGGQSGNPGSPYYDNFIDTWAKGEYYPLWFMKENEGSDKRVRRTIKFGGKAG